MAGQYGKPSGLRGRAGDSIAEHMVGQLTMPVVTISSTPASIGHMGAPRAQRSVMMLAVISAAAPEAR
jgi:hypothetical protein